MKLKFVVASMSILGFISCPLFAATHHKHATHHHNKIKHHAKHIKHVKHTNKHRVKHTTRHHEKHAMMRLEAPVAPVVANNMNSPALAEEENEEGLEPQKYPVNYKGEVTPELCRIIPALLVLESATQNEGRALPNPCSPGWYNRIRVSGGVNVDLGKWGDRNANYEGENYKRVSINDAYVNVSARVTDWANAFVSLSYSNPTSAWSDDGLRFAGMNRSEFSYSNVYKLNELSLEQGYVTIGNFDYSPVYIQIGKQFQDFGRYQIHPITVPLTQVMSETLAESFKAGVILPSGFHASIFTFDDPIDKFDEMKPLNYGFSVGLDYTNPRYGWDVGAAYMRNIIAAKDVAHSVKLFTMEDFYNSRVSGVALYGDVNSGPFTVGVRWVTTVQRFNPRDLPKFGWADVNPATLQVFSDAPGAKPWTLATQAAYSYDPWCRVQTIYVGYQTSREAAGLGLPKDRWLVGWNVDVFKNTNLGIEWDHDKGYRRSQGGISGRHDNTNLVSLRAGVEFS